MLPAFHPLDILLGLRTSRINQNSQLDILISNTDRYIPILKAVGERWAPFEKYNLQVNRDQSEIELLKSGASQNMCSSVDNLERKWILTTMLKKSEKSVVLLLQQDQPYET